MRFIRISPTEIVLLRGALKESVLIQCDDVKECDEVMEFAKSGRVHPKLAPLLDVRVSPPPVAEVVGEGVLAEALRQALREAGVREGRGLTIYAFDTWRPSQLRRIDEEARRAGARYLPVFAVLDLGVVGPLYSPGWPGYRCLELQLTASSNWLFRAIRDLDGGYEADVVALKFLAYLTALLVREGAELLLGRAVLVDFDSFYVDVARVHSTPVCEPEEMVSGL